MEVAALGTAVVLIPDMGSQSSPDLFRAKGVPKVRSNPIQSVSEQICVGRDIEERLTAPNGPPELPGRSPQPQRVTADRRTRRVFPLDSTAIQSRFVPTCTGVWVRKTLPIALIDSAGLGGAANRFHNWP